MTPAIDVPPLARIAGHPRVRAQYLLETAGDPARAAAVMAGEQSSGTFTKLAQETPALIERCGARVESLQEIDGLPAASLPVHGRYAGPTRRAVVEISWGMDNFGASLPNLVATVAGNLFELKEVAGLRLLDLDLPDAFALRYAPPAFGAAGTRRLAQVARGPLIGTIIKPSVGLSPEQTAQNVAALCEGGIDFIKDDELQSDGAHCPFEARVAAVMAVIDGHAQRTGKKPMYAFNITGDLDQMRRRHDIVLAHGGTCVMVSLNSVGLVGVHALRGHAQLPIHGHRNGWGYLSRHPALGFEYAAWHKLWRLAGVDHMHVNGLRNKFSETDDSVIRSARACMTPLFDPPHPGFQAMPVFSSGQWAGQAFDTYAQLRCTDLIYAAGGGIVAHPGGIAAGVDSIRIAWQAAEQGVPIEQAAREHKALAQAIAFFGKA
ncbi:ribulose-bisphosphate carboxylase large subunit family protein [Orrella sp. JC864]|uniref:ribulose-bisphosphate carboxylase large subunit family protein n=1 Tax=Orrella sp. JC864 TaxID=3120298 RepID=UPI00300AF773